MNTYPPLVSILTPVYNGEKFLAECIDSVRNQLYHNWEYIIVNNCSTDSTLDIASHYAATDSRINVINNRTFISVIENYNSAFSLISSKSKYCKVVDADDWLKPDCLSKMIKLAEAHPSIGIVGSYQLSGEEIKWKGLPQDIETISGREVCRLSFLHNINVFGNPTSCLYKFNLVRKNNPFFPHLYPHADTSAFFKYLQYCDFGFVHEILSVQHIHDQQVSSKVRNLHMDAAGCFHILLEYGPIYLTEEEFKNLKIEFLKRYYRFLGGCVLKMEGREFWKFQSNRFKELGYPIRWEKVLRGAIAEIMDEMKNPIVAFQKLLKVLKTKYLFLLQRNS